MAETFKPVREPPGVVQRRTVKYDYWAIADRLRKMPGKWALVWENGPMSFYNSVQNGVNALPPDEFEVTGRDFNREVSPPTCSVYMRYRPEAERKRIKREQREEGA